MATGNTIILFGSEQFQEASNWLEDMGVFFADSLRDARFPTQNELRKAVNAMGFELEEENDWYVTSENDFTEIWFSSDPAGGNTPVEFWCRRGNIIALDIGQAITNICGSFVVINHSDSIPVLIVPDDIFPAIPPMKNTSGFVDTIACRAPFLIKSLQKAENSEILFILSQIISALNKTQQKQFYQLLQAYKDGLDDYKKLLDYEDIHVRRLAFELVTLYKSDVFNNIELLRMTIARENDPETKTRMINAVKQLLTPLYVGQEINEDKKKILDFFHDLSENTEEAPHVCLATTILLAESHPGDITPAMREIIISALTTPDSYALRWNYPGSVFRQALKALDGLLVNQRIDILKNALPRIDVIEDAHDATRALLDNVFFGGIWTTQMSNLPDNKLAERAEIVIEKFRSKVNPPINWLYPSHPKRLQAHELMLFQREALKLVIELELPWMVHSNLLEKYGLPPTRESIREMLSR